jgi:hypothetical protein
MLVQKRLDRDACFTCFQQGRYIASIYWILVMLVMEIMIVAMNLLNLIQVVPICSSNSHFFNKAWCAKRSRAVVTP